MIENIKLVIDALGTAASIVLVITAIIALYIAVKQNSINQESHRPYCDIYCIDCNKDITIKIKNNGLGAMTITDFCISENGTSIKKDNLYSCISCGVPLTYYSVDIVGRSIAPKEGLVLLQKRKNGMTESAEVHTNLRKELAKYTIQLDYKDMYGNPYSQKRICQRFMEGRPELSEEIIY